MGKTRGLDLSASTREQRIGDVKKLLKRLELPGLLPHVCGINIFRNLSDGRGAGWSGRAGILFD